MLRNYLSLFITSLAISFVFWGCDLTNHDIVYPDPTPASLQAKMFVRAGTSALMDFTPFVNSSTLISISKDAQTGTINFVDGKFLRYVPNPYVTEGTDNFIININDTQSQVSVVIMSTSNTNPPCAAGAMSDKTLSKINTSVTIDVLANDQFCGGADLNTFKIITQPTHGQLKIDGSKLTFTPNTNFVGIDKAIYQVSGKDTLVKNSSAEVFFNVVNPSVCDIALTPQNIKWSPTTNNPSIAIDVVNTNTLCNLPVTSLFVSNPPQNGSANIVNNKIVYTPNSKVSFVNDNFMYAFKDSFGATYNSSVQISDPSSACVVYLAPDYPVVTPTIAAASFVIDVFANDTLCGISPKTLAISKSPKYGNAFVNTEFKTTYVPLVGYKGFDFFYYTVTEPSGFVYTGIVKVKVN